MRSKGVIVFQFITSILILCSCGQRDPDGIYSGEIKDWIYEVFEANVNNQGNQCKIEVVLRQVPEGFLSELTFIHPKDEKVVRTESGKSKMDTEAYFFDDKKIHLNII